MSWGCELRRGGTRGKARATEVRLWAGQCPQPADRAPIDPAWVDETFSQVEDLTYSGDAAGLAAMIAKLTRERYAGTSAASGDRPF